MPAEENMDRSAGNYISRYRPVWRKPKSIINTECGLENIKANVRVTNSCGQYENAEEGFRAESRDRFVNDAGKITKEGTVLGNCLLAATCHIAKVFACGRIFEINAYNRQVELQKEDPDLVVGP